MIETHTRYSYSSLPSRPRYRWPNGTRVAVYVAMNVEAFRFGTGKGAGIAPRISLSATASIRGGTTETASDSGV